MFKGSQFLKLIAPNVDLQHNILILAYLGHISSQNSLKLILVELLFSHIISRLLVWVCNFRFLFLLVVVIKVFRGLVESLEEVHHVSEPNVDLKLIDVVEDIRRLDLAVNIKSYLRTVETEALTVGLHHLHWRLLLRKHQEQLVVIDLRDAHKKQRN